MTLRLFGTRCISPSFYAKSKSTDRPIAYNLPELCNCTHFLHNTFSLQLYGVCDNKTKTNTKNNRCLFEQSPPSLITLPPHDRDKAKVKAAEIISHVDDYNYS